LIESSFESKKLENSYAGHLGKIIEPAIKPLGYDWKIGIALITSFAAREVFVGTMSTLYSVGNTDNSNQSLKQKMMSAKNPETGNPVFTIATVFSLLIFYAFAMQCMSTVAVVYRESGSWKWAAVQIIYMTALAYTSSLGVYYLLR
jgi:ferrous iron transport protein B